MLLLHFLVILFSQSEAKASISRVCRAGLLAGSWRFNTEGNVALSGAGCPGDKRGRYDLCTLAAGFHMALPSPSGFSPAAVGSNYLSRDAPLMLAVLPVTELAEIRAEACPCRCVCVRAVGFRLFPANKAVPLLAPLNLNLAKQLGHFLFTGFNVAAAA